MKKLMLLGGGRYLVPAIEAAHKLGVYVITADYLPGNYAHKFSDEYVNVSIIDKEAVLKVAQEKKIDGIMSFACDPGVVPAAYVAEKMGLPQTGPYESVCILQNKEMFRSFLKENGFNVPFFSSYSSIEEALNDDNVPFPCIVKPVDSSGSKGVTRIESIEQMPKAVEKALSESMVGMFIVEEFIEPIGHPSDADAFSVNGELVVFSMDDQWFDKEAANIYTPAAFTFPSTMDSKVQDALKADIQRLIKLLAMKTCIYNIETRLGTDGKAYIMECTPRSGGNRLAEVLRYASGIDIITASIEGALGMKIENLPKEINYDGHWCEIILHGTKTGRFQGINIKEPYEDMIIDEDIWLSKGEKVEMFIGANKAIGNIIFNCTTEDNKEQLICYVNKWIKVLIFEDSGGGIT